MSLIERPSFQLAKSEVMRFFHHLRISFRSYNLSGDAAYVKQCIDELIPRFGCALIYITNIDSQSDRGDPYHHRRTSKVGKFKSVGISEPNAESLRKAAKVRVPAFGNIYMSPHVRPMQDAKISALQQISSRSRSKIEETLHSFVSQRMPMDDI
jgi:hypothetical protein